MTGEWKRADEMKKWLQEQLTVSQQRLLHEQVAKEELEKANQVSSFVICYVHWYQLIVFGS